MQLSWQAMSLQDAISQYVTTTDEDWPLVKQVTLRVPNSALCSGGASLIDLPEVGDSNPARDDVAKKVIISYSAEQVMRF